MAHALRYLIAAFFTAASAVAAENPVTRFTVFAARPIVGVEFAPSENAKLQKVVFYPTARSPRYEFRDTMPLRFVEASTGRVVAEAAIPLHIRDALLLFTPIEPSPRDGLAYRIAVLDNGAARHAAGGLSIVNLSGLQLSGIIGRHTVNLQPGLNPTLDVGTTAEIALRATFKERTYQSYADQLDLGANDRALLILFPPYYAGSLEVQSRMLVDRPPAIESSR